MGSEEHTLEITNVVPGTAAEKAGLQAGARPTAFGAAARTLAGLIGPGQVAADGVLNKIHQMGHDGDMIIAVDGHRVHYLAEWEDELAKLKPGDTVYLTILRPLANGNHQQMRVAVKLTEMPSSVEANNARDLEFPY